MASFTPLSLQHVLLCSLRTIVLPLGQPCRGPSSSTQTPWMSSCRSLGCGKARQLSHLGSSPDWRWGLRPGTRHLLCPGPHGSLVAFAASQERKGMFVQP